MRSLLLAVVLAVALAGLSAPAAADIPRNVHDGRSGVVDVGWVRVLCATSDDGAKCAMRAPEGFSRLDAVFRGESGEFLGRLKALTGQKRTHDRLRTVNRQVVKGVHLSCDDEDGRLACTLVFAPRFKDFKFAVYSSGELMGGLNGFGVQA